MNEYKKKFDELREKDSFKGEQWFGKRQELVEEYSWAVPNAEVLLYLSQFDNIVEVGAGNGYWAHCIEEAGGSVEPYDVDPAPEHDQWTAVGQRDCLRLGEPSYDQPMLMVWPPTHNTMASEIAREKPPHLLYVGEEKGGCTANNTFFKILESEYGLVGKIDLPSYAGVDDNFFHYVLKRP
jgi:hypothetical protein